MASHRAEARNQGSAKKLYDAGQLAEAKDDVITAYEDYLQAFKKDPKDLRYKTAWQRTRFTAAEAHVSGGEKLRQQGDNSEALTEFVHALGPKIVMRADRLVFIDGPASRACGQSALVRWPIHLAVYRLLGPVVVAPPGDPPEESRLVKRRSAWWAVEVTYNPVFQARRSRS